MLAPGLENISPAVWRDAIARTTSFARSFARRLPRHLAVEDIVHFAVESVLSGRRTCDLARMSLPAILCGVVRSVVSPRGLAAVTQEFPSATDDEIARVPAPERDEECLFSPEDHERLFELVRRETPGDRLFHAYIDLFRANWPADEGAARLGVPVSKYYELHRKLKLIVRRVMADLNPADLPL